MISFNTCGDPEKGTLFAAVLSEVENNRTSVKNLRLHTLYIRYTVVSVRSWLSSAVPAEFRPLESAKSTVLYVVKAKVVPELVSFRADFFIFKSMRQPSGDRIAALLTMRMATIPV